jgi:competence protein ComEC
VLLRDALDPSLVLACALLAGALLPLVPVPVLAGGAAVCVLAHRHVGRGMLVLAVSVLALGAARAHLAVARYEAAREEASLALPVPARCEVRGVVASSPVRVHGTPRWALDAGEVACAGAPVDWRGQVALYGGPESLARGDEIVAVAQLAPPQRLWNEETGDPRPGEARRGALRSGGVVDLRIQRRASGVLAWVDRVRARVRSRIDATFPETTAPMARALVLGESDLAAEDDAAFRASGLAHLLAVSGMHLVLVILGAVAAMRALLLRVEQLSAGMDVGRLCAAAGVPLAWLYAELAGASGSALRAAWMLTVGLLARALGRRADGPRSLGLSIIAMALVDPLVVHDVSFVLSAAATAGILLLAPLLSAVLTARLPALLHSIARGAAVTAAASAACAPILARFSPRLPLIGLLANLLAVPVGELAALPLCLLHALLAPWTEAERGCAVVASGALAVVRGVARVASAPTLSLAVPPPTSWQLMVLGVAVAAIAFRPAWRRVAAAVGVFALAVLELTARACGAPKGTLRTTFLDVGQGDSAIVDLPNGSALVIDGGGLVGSPLDVGARVLGPVLRARRRDALAVAILSHPHPDHFLGFVSGLAGVRVGELWDTGQGETESVGGPYAALLAGRTVVRPAALCGARAIGGAHIEVLAPCPAPAPDRGPNDNSFVLRIRYGARSILFVGDAEREEERDLLRLGAERLHADVLKVGHHGSRTSSSPDFLAAVAPREAIVSAGIRNRYGHPHADTLAALAAAGTRIWRTDRDGAVTVTTDGASLDVRCAAAEITGQPAFSARASLP